MMAAAVSCEEDCDDMTNDPGGGGGSYCCKVCTNSKPCGDSCIATNQTCHQTGGALATA
jgi:hypothetical protein